MGIRALRVSGSLLRFFRIPETTRWCHLRYDARQNPAISRLRDEKTDFGTAGCRGLLRGPTLQANDWKNAPISEVQKAAEQGDADAQQFLVSMYSA